MVSEARTIREAGARGRVEPSRECILDHAVPGSSTETASFCCRNSFQGKRKMHARELPEAAWHRTYPRDASTLHSPRKRNSRAAQHDSLKRASSKPKHYPQLKRAFNFLRISQPNLYRLSFIMLIDEALPGDQSSTFTRRHPEPALLCLPSMFRGRRRRVCSAALQGSRSSKQDLIVPRCSEADPSVRENRVKTLRTSRGLPQDGTSRE